MKPIKTAEFVKSSSKVEECPEGNLPEYAFIGRSNVGKSSLINLLTNHGKLAKVSSKPGKTQLINHFLIDKEWYLVDLPGYGWAKVSKSQQAAWKKMIARYFETRENLTNVFVLIDSRHEPQRNDLDFVNSLGKAGLPIALIFTKVDKNGMPKSQSNAAMFLRALKKDWAEVPPHFMTSTVTGYGKDDVVRFIRDINQQISQ
ncbi:ribosome biogenesis GTP-binding protein YihA/YsxC [Marinoscillum furvescens]|uniref:Probable GTP-binding protein EngB n=1 Tax=Marinoscillum furvescens DSM 4134 TaxID=1122208 RepID=A0A3D9LGK7_MARFU|nr:ribosome biogenesis GTP-binding protein YihA/YsxC [Marinoscillum furvescens]REE05747.1 GTP-binding protein [Marinoscillum furvescens DSM 4134]